MKELIGYPASTLLTARQSWFLEYHAKKHGTTKSQILRDLVTEMIEGSDVQYPTKYEEYNK
jgi:hypothetical protein